MIGIIIAGAVFLSDYVTESVLSINVWDIPTDGLADTVLAGEPQEAFDSITVLPLDNTITGIPLWAVHSSGMVNWDTNPMTDHFLAIFTWEDSTWIELDRITMVDESIDYMFSDGVKQEFITDDFIWLAVEGGIGAHSGAYELLTFDGKYLDIRFSSSHCRPGFAWLENLPADSLTDLLLDYSDPYVFFYASGVIKPDIRIQRWDSRSTEMVAMNLRKLPPATEYSLREPVNRAVEFAEAGLWLQAFTAIGEVLPLPDTVSDPERWIIVWNETLISQNLETGEGSVEGGYPLLGYVFYGDYQASIDIMRQYAPEEIFCVESPLIQGTVAQGWETELSGYLISCTESALEVEPECAAAFYLHGWALYLSEQSISQIIDDVQKAVRFDPSEPLYALSLEYLTE
ncbi:MAG: hypothetical protein K8R76_03785 [Candidatus Aegiribacteria sp.]|nr:hypothetical protein [Candidatus Aegiribacteria sp.]